MDLRRRLARLLALTALAAGLSFSSADASGTAASVVPAGGFAGAVRGPARPIDRDLESGMGSLHAVRCAANAAAAACWVR
jgi:hypothetical protein